MLDHGLSILIFLPVLAGLAVLALPLSNAGARVAGLVVSLAMLPLGAAVFFGFAGTGGYEFIEHAAWLSWLGIHYTVGVDGISLLILLVIVFLFPSVFLILSGKPKGYWGNLMVVQGAMTGAVTAADMILFYLFWELMLIPIFFMMGLYGGKGKVAATIKITIYTMVGSLLMLAAIVYLGVMHHAQFGLWSFDIGDLSRLHLTGTPALLAFMAFILAFAIKIPLFPLHTWLPDAYTEAPAGTTFVLSAIMAKLGIYAMLRFVFPFFMAEYTGYGLLLATAGVIGMVYCGVAAIAQSDIKRLLAYSSASHMGMIAIGIFAMNVQSVTVSLYQIVAHATSTGALFIFVGLLEEQMDTRKIESLGGVAYKAPVFALFFAIAMLASVGLPGTSGFIGEFLIILGAVKYNVFIGVVAATSMIIGVCYMLWMFQRVFFEKTVTVTEKFRDLKPLEFIGFAPIIILIVVMGVYPSPFIKKIEPTVQRQIAALYKTERVVERDHRADEILVMMNHVEREEK
jgi:NADH-quinone oxidoreductase subunit M